MGALKSHIISSYSVRRDGHFRPVTATDLVPGDVLLLKAGQLVPADCLHVQGGALQVRGRLSDGRAGGRSLPDWLRACPLPATLPACLPASS